MKNRTLLLAFLALINIQLIGQVSFEQINGNMNLNDTTKSFGMYWGDYDNSGFPDLFVPNHYNPFISIDPSSELKPILYINNLGFGFSSVIAQTLDVKDFHGMCFYRTKESSYQNILALTGSANKNILFRTPFETGNIADTTCALCPSIGKSRTAMTMDYDLDGRTDIFVNNDFSDLPQFRLSSMYRQLSDFTFELVEDLEFFQSNFSQQADIDNDGERELIISNDGKYRIYDYVSGQLELAHNGAFGAGDMSIQDFDGDGDFEMLISERVTFNELVVNNNRIDTYLAFNSGYSEIVFSAPSSFEFQTYSYPFTFVGYKGEDHILYDIHGPYTVNDTDLDYHNWPIDTLEENYINLSYDDVTELWRLQINRFNNKTVRVRISSSSGGMNFQSSTNIDTSVMPAPFHLIEFEDVGDQVEIVSDQILADIPCLSFVTEDFDNDSDLDLVLYPLDHLNNPPLNFVENVDGTLDFNNIIELNASTLGYSDASTAIDVDNDGRMDIARTSAGRFPGEYAAIDLFRNTSSQVNNWVKIDLQGVVSNADGLGSFVTIYSNSISQVRLFDGGFHKFAQDQATLHYGLGTSQSIDSLVINWPSGIAQSIGNLNVNQSYLINEIDGITSITEPFELSSITIGPNPSDNIYSIGNIPLNSRLELINSSGQLLMSEKSIGPSFILELGHLADGIYFLRIKNTFGSKEFKLIKQK